LDPHGYRDSGFGVWDKEQPINRGHNKVVTTTAASAAKKTKTKTRIGIRIGIEPSTRIRSKTKQIERLHRMQNEQKNARKAWT